MLYIVVIKINEKSRFDSLKDRIKKRSKIQSKIRNCMSLFIY